MLSELGCLTATGSGLGLGCLTATGSGFGAGVGVTTGVGATIGAGGGSGGGAGVGVGVGATATTGSVGGGSGVTVGVGVGAATTGCAGFGSAGSTGLATRGHKSSAVNAPSESTPATMPMTIGVRDLGGGSSNSSGSTGAARSLNQPSSPVTRCGPVGSSFIAVKVSSITTLEVGATGGAVTMVERTSPATAPAGAVDAIAGAGSRRFWRRPGFVSSSKPLLVDVSGAAGSRGGTFAEAAALAAATDAGSAVGMMSVRLGIGAGASAGTGATTGSGRIMTAGVSSVGASPRGTSSGGVRTVMSGSSSARRFAMNEVIDAKRSSGFFCSAMLITPSSQGGQSGRVVATRGVGASSTFCKTSKGPLPENGATPVSIS